MRTGTCPKCNSTEVYCADSDKPMHSGLYTCRDSNPYLHIGIDKGGFFGLETTLLPFSCYVCRHCGYFELYVRDTSQLAKLADALNWRKAGTQA